MSLGFAMASLGDTTSVELQHCLVLNGCKLVGLPCLYLLSARLLGCPAPPEFLVFLGTLPATVRQPHELSLAPCTKGGEGFPFDITRGHRTEGTRGGWQLHCRSDVRR